MNREHNHQTGKKFLTVLAIIAILTSCGTSLWNFSFSIFTIHQFRNHGVERNVTVINIRDAKNEEVIVRGRRRQLDIYEYDVQSDNLSLVLKTRRELETSDQVAILEFSSRFSYILLGSKEDSLIGIYIESTLPGSGLFLFRILILSVPVVFLVLTGFLTWLNFFMQDVENRIGWNEGSFLWKVFILLCFLNLFWGGVLLIYLFWN